MLSPQTDAYAPVVRFATSRAERAAIAGIAALLATGALAAWFLWPAPAGVRLAVSLLAVAAAVGCGLRAWMNETVEIDVDRRSCEREISWAPLRRRRRLDLSESVDIRWASDYRSRGSDGIPVKAYRAWLTTGDRTLQLSRGWIDPAAPDFLGLMAERLRANLVHDPRGGKPAFSAAALCMWTGIIVVFGTMYWPVLSGRKPLRPFWENSVAREGPRYPRERMMFEQGVDAYRQGKFAEAEKFLMNAVEAGGGKAEALNMLAYARAGLGNLDGALKTAVEALSHAPASGMILDTVGEMHELRGELEKAVRYYRQALAHLETTLTPAETNAKLGRTLLRMERRAEAIDHLREASRYGSDRFAIMARDLLVEIGEEPFVDSNTEIRRQGQTLGSMP